MDLDQTLLLRRASIYARPQDPAALLGRHFGNFSDPLVAPHPIDGTGLIPCPCVDTDNLIYHVNDGRAVSTFPEIYFNGKVQEPTVAIWNPANNLEGHGLVATLQFRLIDLLGGEVSVRFSGSADAMGNPITNPVLGLFTMLTEYAGWTLNDFDRGTCEVSSRDMAVLGYNFYWSFREERTIREWLLELLPTYHTDFSESGNDQLAIILDRSLTVYPVNVAYHVPAYEIDDMGSPIQALRFTAHADDVANQVTVHGRHNWVTGAPTVSYRWDYLHSQSAYQAVAPVDFTFRGMYTEIHAVQWLNSFAMRHGFEPKTVSFTMKGLKGIPLIFPRFITVEWPLLGWSQHLLKIQRTAIRWASRRVQLDCIDCGREITDVITSPLATPTQRRQQLSRIYTYVPGTIGDGGDIRLAPSNPKNESANGDFESGDNGQWDLYGGNAAKQWGVVENPATAYVGTRHLLHNLGSGTGYARSLLHRIDPGQWGLVSAWFRQHTAGTNGAPCATITFYDRAEQLLFQAQGNYVEATDTWLESVVMIQPPALAYYYRPGIGFAALPTTGQWRADYVFAVSGSQDSVLATRAGAIVSRNSVINGDFELGDVMYLKTPGWIITNNPSSGAHSGIWKAVHGPSISGEHRLNSLTKIAVTAGQVFTLQAWVMTLNNPTGTGRLGVTWIDAGGNAFGENATTGTAGPIAIWALASGSMTVPTNAISAHCWLGVSNHTGPAFSYWVVDDVLISTGT